MSEKELISKILDNYEYFIDGNDFETLFHNGLSKKDFNVEEAKIFLDLLRDSKVCGIDYEKLLSIINKYDYWKGDFETTRIANENGIIEIIKKIPKEFREDFNSFCANYWDCGWIHSMEVLNSSEISQLEKVISDKSSNPKVSPVPCEYICESHTTWGNEIRKMKVSRYERKCELFYLDPESKVINKHAYFPIDCDIVVKFFNQIRCIKDYSKSFDYCETHTMNYPDGKCVKQIGLLERYYETTISAFELAENIGLIKR